MLEMAITLCLLRKTRHLEARNDSIMPELFVKAKQENIGRDVQHFINALIG